MLRGFVHHAGTWTFERQKDWDTFCTTLMSLHWHFANAVFGYGARRWSDERVCRQCEMLTPAETLHVERARHYAAALATGSAALWAGLKDERRWIMHLQETVGWIHERVGLMKQKRSELFTMWEDLENKIRAQPQWWRDQIKLAIKRADECKRREAFVQVEEGWMTRQCSGIAVSVLNEKELRMRERAEQAFMCRECGALLHSRRALCTATEHMAYRCISCGGDALLDLFARAPLTPTPASPWNDRCLQVQLHAEIECPELERVTAPATRQTQAPGPLPWRATLRANGEVACVETHQADAEEGLIVACDIAEWQEHCEQHQPCSADWSDMQSRGRQRLPWCKPLARPHVTN